MNQLDLLDMIYNPNPNDQNNEQNNYEANAEYILEYQLESENWIQILECNNTIMLEIVMESYMRIIERVTGNIVMLHDIQRPIINK